MTAATLESRVRTTHSEAPAPGAVSRLAYHANATHLPRLADALQGQAGAPRLPEGRGQDKHASRMVAVLAPAKLGGRHETA